MSASKDNANMPAMPLGLEFHNDNGDCLQVIHIGLTKREDFAKAALQGILSNPLIFKNQQITPETFDQVAEIALHFADSQLAALEASYESQETVA